MVTRWIVSYFLLLSLAASYAGHGDEMARSDFHWGAEDWEVFGPGQLKLYEKGGVLYGSDAGRTVWYFSAPAKFLGDKSFAHNGKLSFRLGHSEYMSNGKDMIKDWDVILESKEWRIRVGVRNLIPPWVGATNNELSLNEKSWVVMKGPGHGHAPTEIQMLRLLSSLSAIYFRGGYYDGHEETWIDSVVLTEGDHHEEKMLRKVTKHHHEPLRKKKEMEEQKRKEQELEMLISAGQIPHVLQDSTSNTQPDAQPAETRVESVESPPPPQQEPIPPAEEERVLRETPQTLTGDMDDAQPAAIPSTPSSGDAFATEDVARAARAAPRLVPDHTQQETVALPDGATVEDVLGGSRPDPEELRRASEAQAQRARLEAEARLAEAAAAARAREEAEAAARAKAEAEAAEARAKAEAEAAEARARAEAEAAEARRVEEEATRRAETEAAAAREREAAEAARRREQEEAEATARAERAAAEAAAEARRAEEEAAALAKAEQEAAEERRRVEEAARAREAAETAARAQETGKAQGRKSKDEAPVTKTAAI